MGFDRHLQSNESPSLGDILRDALESNDKIASKITITFPPKSAETPQYFQQQRSLVVDMPNKIERIKQYRNKKGCTLIEAKRSVEVMMLIEMLNQAQSMDDIDMIRRRARFQFSYLWD